MMSIMILVFFLLLIILLGAAIVFVLVTQRRSGDGSPSPSGERPVFRAELSEASHTAVSLKPKSGGTSRDETVASGSIGNYELISELGEGGMGIVYKARQATLDRIVALKVLLPNLSRKDRFVQRFMREAKNAATLDHPNIVTIYEVGEDNGSYYFSMKYVEGEDLDQLVERGPLSVDDASAIVLQIAGGLAHAHERGVIHRDIKPANIILDTTGRAVITDFGIARAVWEERMTSTGMSMGTVEYMSPEQFKGGDVDEKSDIYALAATFYTLITGSSPFPGATTQEVMYKKFKEVPIPPTEINRSLPPWVDLVIARAMAEDPAGRYPTASDLARDIRAGLEGTLGAASVEPEGEREKKGREAGAAPTQEEPEAPLEATVPDEAGVPSGADGKEAFTPAEEGDIAPDAALSGHVPFPVEQTDQRRKILFIFVGVLAAVFVFLLGSIGFWVMKHTIIPKVTGGGAPGGGSPMSGGRLFGSGCDDYLDESIIRSVFASTANEEGASYDLMNVYYFEGSFTAPNRREAIVSFEDYNQSNVSEVSEVWLITCDGGWHKELLVIEGDYCEINTVDVNNDGVDELEAYVSNYSSGFGGVAYYLFALKGGYVNTVYTVFGEDQLGAPSDWAYNADHYIYFEDRDGNGILELIDELTYTYYSYDYHYNEWEYQSDEYYIYVYTFGLDGSGDLYLGSYE
ncbi:MAG: serine/threonine protein kinase [Deltaproteobacteria bacterium]|nr:serine/threonine protein kinase [Candidatus Zymogenaceae bacterium]